MRALITGGLGFAGAHLAKHLVDCRDDVAVTYLSEKDTELFKSGLIKSDSISKLEQARRQMIPRQVQQVGLDVTNRGHFDQVLSLMKPDVVYHLAGVAFVPNGDRDFELVFRINAFGVKNLLDSVKTSCPDCRVLVVSSGEVYGMPRVSSQGFLEVSELRPTSIYGASKVSAEMFVHKAVARDGIQAVVVRPFAHVGPFQEDTFSLSSFAKQIALIKLGRREPILEVGNLDVKRDFSDVSDIVRGYRESAINGRVGEVYNLCSGNSYLLKELVDSLIKISGVEVEIKVSEDRLRPIDIPEYFGNPQKAFKDFGWKSRVETESMLTGLFSYWLEFLSN